MTQLFVVIPVFHGASCVFRSLDSLARQRLYQVHPKDVTIAVVINDGREDSVNAANTGLKQLAEKGCRTLVISACPGRSTAFQAAESYAAACSHRVYLDQDACLSPGSLAALARVFDSSHLKFATLQPRFEPSPSPWVRGFCRAWLRFPYVRRSPATMGLYAVSAAGRKRWGDWPPLIADDKFVRLLFAPHERARIDTESYTVLPPASRRDLSAARARYRRSNAQLRASGYRDQVKRYAGIMHAYANPRHWADLMVLAYVETAARLFHGRR